MVAPGSFQVPLTQQDLPPDVTYRQIIESLGALQQASDDVFSRIEDCVAERRGGKLFFYMPSGACPN